MVIYVVQPGDTVAGIAENFGVAQERILYVNQIIYPYLLAVGQALLLPEAPADGAEIDGAEMVLPDRTGLPQAVMNGYAYPFIDRTVLQETLPYLTALYVFSYGFTAQGVPIPPEADDLPMIRMAIAQGVDPVLTLTPFDEEGRFSNYLITELIRNPEAVENLILNLLRIMEQKGFRGVDVDFEYILAADRDAFTAFVAELTRRMNAEGYTVSVALAPKTSDDQQGLLYEGKDYARLGAAANSVLLMTYEWGYTYGPPMAVAPLNQVRRVVEYAVTRIPAEKIDLGIPNYGYDWALPFVQGVTAARTLGNIEAVRQAAEKGAEIFFDETAQSPYYFYTEEGVTHEVWFEDVRSIQAKFDLLKEFRLRGAGYWQLTRLFRANWLLAEENFRIVR